MTNLVWANTYISGYVMPNSVGMAVGSAKALHDSPGFLKRDPRPPLKATERFSGGHEQRPPLGSFAVILHDPVSRYIYIRQ